MGRRSPLPRTTPQTAARPTLESTAGVTITPVSNPASRVTFVKNAAADGLLVAIDAVCGGVSYLSPVITQQVVDAIARPAEASPSSLGVLTDREREVLQLIAEGLSSKEIAAMLGVSLKTVDSHRSNLMEKLDIHKVSGLVRFAIRSGLVEA